MIEERLCGLLVMLAYETVIVFEEELFALLWQSHDERFGPWFYLLDFVEYFWQCTNKSFPSACTSPADLPFFNSMTSASHSEQLMVYS